MSDSVYFNQSTGKASDHIDFDSLEAPVHREIVDAVQDLKKEAKGAGFELSIASGFRDFDRQQRIWDNKAKGLWPVVDTKGNTLDINMFTKAQWIEKILRLSALPGASRHHWGTEIDIYDKQAMVDDYQLQLTEAETQEGGVFAEMHLWISEQLKHNRCEFFQPYARDLGGVSREPWHLSFRTVANRYEKIVTEENLLNFFHSVDFALKLEVFANFSDIYHRFIKNNSL